jgi:hypothetical protein
MQEHIFYRLDPFLISLIYMGVLVATSEIGLWVKKGRSKDSQDTIEKSDIALILGSVLTMLALLLAFTYSMAENRFETRRQLVIEEANAIGTTYLRAKTLPEPRSSEIQHLLRQYAALRVEIGDKVSGDMETIREIRNRTTKVNDVLWSHAAAIARETQNPVISIFLQSLNEMIDLREKRWAAFNNRVPSSIYIVIVIFSIITVWLVGYYFKSHGRREQMMTIMFSLLVSLVIWLIMDLDQPVRGAIRTSQQSLIDLNQSLIQESNDAAKTSR